MNDKATGSVERLDDDRDAKKGSEPFSSPVVGRAAAPAGESLGPDHASGLQAAAAGTDEGPAAELSAHVREEIDRWVAKFPEGRQRSAVLAALHAVQHENQGFLTRSLLDAVAAYLSLPPIQVYEVASFYSMFETKPVGRRHISVCTNISCMLRGSDEIVAHIERRLGIKTGQSTPDGAFYLKREEECLAACVGAPMMMIDHRYYENLTPEKVDAVLDELKVAK